MSVRKVSGRELLGGRSAVAFAGPGPVQRLRKLKLKKARDFAVAAHGDQQYGAYPYVKHLEAVVRVLEDFGFAGDHLVAGWLHDVIEDTDATQAEIKAAFGGYVASLVWAVTGGGERATHVASIHEKIAAFPDAAVIKLADRIANVEASQPGDRHSTRYRTEHTDFTGAIQSRVPAEMWKRYLQAVEVHGGPVSA
jgi:(p)ppGpp synthase/HD superfamily hydrolase